MFPISTISSSIRNIDFNPSLDRQYAALEPIPPTPAIKTDCFPTMLNQGAELILERVDSIIKKYIHIKLLLNFL